MIIRRSISSKLSLALLLMAIPVFVVALGLLYSQSRHLIRKEALARAYSVLSVTRERVCRNLMAVETATNAYSWLVSQNLHPDSILALTRRVVSLNAHIDGCSVSTEPYVFPEHGRYFSAYSIKEADSVHSVIELPYEYFGKVWYKSAADSGEALWVNFYDEADSLEMTLDGMVASYSKPIYDDNGCLLAVISTDIALQRLSKVITEEKPYPNSYFIMTDRDGRYFIHPDSTRLFTHNILEDDDPHSNRDLIILAHEMARGSQGTMHVRLDGVSCHVAYQPVPSTTWCLAIVCPDADILQGYDRLARIIIPLLIAGLLVIILFSYQAVARAISPINQLLDKTQSIAAGNLDVVIPATNRNDAVGLLQNSFATMLDALRRRISGIRQATEEIRQRNAELAQATRLAEEADRHKKTFIQNVTHQVRTPLNIIMGFAQLLRDGRQSLSHEELTTVTDTMRSNANHLSRIVLMLFDSSDNGHNEERLAAHNLQAVSCNSIAQEAIHYLQMHYPDAPVKFCSDVPDDFCITTNRLYLVRTLREILYNAAKYSDRQNISFSINASSNGLHFIIQDTGPGISEEDRQRLFDLFTKVDDLSEGLGLGLPLAKRHARTLGADLSLDDTYTLGCRFVITIPLAT